MAGFKPKRTLYKLTFEDPDLEGLEVVAKGTSFDGLLQVAAIADEMEQLDAETASNAELLPKLREVVVPFAKLLVSWNVVDDDDKPVPATVDGLLSQEVDFVSQIITAYVAAMSKAPPPLPAGSGSGGTSPEPSLNLENVSTPLASSSPPT